MLDRIKRIWKHMWMNNFVGMAFLMAMIPTVLIALVVVSCAGPDHAPSEGTGKPVIIKVTDGRVYDCVQVDWAIAFGQAQSTLIDCQKEAQ